jgi:hypothetical protein
MQMLLKRGDSKEYASEEGEGVSSEDDSEVDGDAGADQGYAEASCDVRPLMRRRLSANQLQMLLNRGDYEEDADASEAEESDAEDSDAEEGAAELSNAEDSDAEESAAELSDAEDSDAEESAAEVSNAEASDAEESAAELSDAEDSDAEESAVELSNAEDSDAAESAAESSNAEDSDTEESDASSEAHSGDDGVGAWPKELDAADPVRSCEARRERYAVALMVVAKLKGEGAVGPHHAGALKDLALLDDPLVMAPVDAFLATEDFEALVEQLHAVAVGAASMA